MSTVSSRSLRRPARSVAAAPAIAGFRPAAAALAIATAFSLQPVSLHAQPAGAQVVHGAASIARDGNNLLVTTQNGNGTRHSAINWQSFSVPAGSITQFHQPSATSTSINRVTGNDASAIFGTLSSNGRLVLVNPAGIAVGKGAIVDTAGFTASTLRMSDADALAGRMLFSGGGGNLQVDGHVVARSGDVVLIAPNVQAGATALIQSQGATVLAAGQSVEITGRGLEGIRLHVTAPGNEAVNLGALAGDAVGIFAGTLRHSGAIRANAVSAEGGRVVLRATGDSLVSGSIAAAQGDRGGSIDVLGQRVGLLAGASLQASGDSGGGQVRVGGDYQGLNAEVPNASHTYVDAQARIEANAGSAGDGGRVIVWADDTTRMQGRIAARGGAAAGNGGFAEVSGKRYLEYTGRVDLRAPNGHAGALLLDPNDIEIWSNGPTQTTSADSVFSGGGSTTRINVGDLIDQLNLGSVRVLTSAGSSGPNGGSITLMSGANVNWTAATTLSLQADSFIELQGSVRNQTAGSALHLLAKAGNITQTGTASVIEIPQLYAVARPGQVLLNGANRVGTLAGESTGPGARFEFTNAQQLKIGAVSTAFGGWAGIDAHDNINPGFVNVRTTAGSLMVGGSGNISGGTVTLTAAGAADDVLIDNARVEASDGAVTIVAGRDVGLSVTQAGNSYVNGAQSTLVTAGRDVLVGSVAFSTNYAYAQIGSGSLVRIQAGRDAVFGSQATSPYYGQGYVYGQGGATGGVSIAAGNNVDFRTVSTVRAYQAPINVLANNSILGAGDFYSGGSLAGTIDLTATNGSLNYDRVNSSGSYSGMSAGRIRLQARTDVTGGVLEARGRDASFSLGSAAGGMVEVTSVAGNIHIASLMAPGGSTSWGSAPGGMGGGALLRALAGHVTVTDRIDVGGGSGDGSAAVAGGGRGGSVDIQAAGHVVAPHIFAEGGYSILGTTAAGDGGSVRIQAGGDITLRSSYYEGTPVTVNGGIGGDSGAGGNAGTIWIKAGGSVVARMDQEPEVNLALASEGPSLMPGLSAVGGFGNAGGRGGGITVEAGANVDAGALFANGGSGFGRSDAPGAPGGQGGTIDVRFGGTAAVDGLIATGGYGADGSSGGAGGHGGAISLGRTAGDLTIGSSPHFSASGGGGGNALTETGTRGVGGNGGSVVLGSAGGTLTLQAPSVFVNGGLDGLRPGETRPEPPGTGAAGSPGNFSTMAARVDVVGEMRVDGHWTNPAGTLVNLPTGASLFTRGFTNRADATVMVNGTLDSAGPIFINQGFLAGTGTLIVAGGAGRVQNSGTIAPAGVGTVGTLTLSSHLSLLEGSVLALDVLSSTDFDVLKVSGAVEGGGTVAVSPSPPPLPPGSSAEVVQAGSVDGTPTGSGVVVTPSASGFRVSAPTPAPTPAPAPAPTPAPSPAPATQAPVTESPPQAPGLPKDLPAALKVIEAEPPKNQVVGFLEAFVETAAEQQRQEAKKNEVGKDDITVTGTACTP